MIFAAKMTDKQDRFNGTGDVDLWLMRMKFYCSTKKFEGKHEAHAIASKLEGAAFLCVARPDEDQDDPDKVKAALKKEFDKEAVDHEKAVDKLRCLKRKNGKTPAQLAWRIEKFMGKAYPELCGSKDEAAKKTHLQMLQDTFVGAIDETMSQKLKTNPKHHKFNLTKLAEELERLELIYHPSTPQLNNICQSERNEGSSLREIVREEIASALAKKNEKTSTQQEGADQSSQVGFLGNTGRKPKYAPRGNNPRNQGCFHCQSKEHFKKNCPFRNLCQRCWKTGHMAPLCTAPHPSPSPALNFQAAGNNQQSK